MQTEQIVLDPKAARTLYREYKKHVHYSNKIDHAIRRVYQLIAQGKMVIKALESIRRAGLDAEGLPKLAIARADVERCYLTLAPYGSATFSSIQWRAPLSARFEFPTGTFPQRTNWVGKQAIVPIIPVHLRPRKAIERYHILWEADWHAVPKDPLLLRRIDGDLWLVVAQWDLTEVERAALATRVSN